MSYKFNPFTDTLDLVGSSDSYIDGDVEYHSNLPVTLGSPAVNSAFLVRKGEGLYFISRKPAGIWVRELNNGNLDDWKFAGLFSDLYRDANFRIISDSDTSKELAFSLSGLTTATTSTLTVPASGTIARTEDFASPPQIGSTTPNTGAFTTLTASSLVASGNVGNTASVLELRSGTSPQTFRLYGTYSSGTSYQRMTVRSVKQTLSALSGASATTTGTLIPDGAVVVGVTTRVATAITGATGYQVGDGTDADRWGDINAIALNTTSDNRDWTAGTIECFTSGGEVTLTANGSDFTAGAVEICVFYLAGEAD
jgi:hypothetical protein